MRDRAGPTLCVVLCTPHGRQLAILLVREGPARGRARWRVPRAPIAGASLDAAAASLARRAAGARVPWLAQAGAFAAGVRGADDGPVTIAYGGVTPRPPVPPPGGKWFAARDLPALPPRDRLAIGAVLAQLRERLDRAPIAFHLLGATFTLSALQGVYELLLGHRLHKASFRRALQAASLVKPTDQWTSAGRGRPAQLFRYAPRRRRGARQGVRFELPRASMRRIATKW